MACIVKKITIVYSAGGNVLKYKIECDAEACKEFGRECKEVTQHHIPNQAWTKFCRCVEVKDGKYIDVTDDPPPDDLKCKEGGLVLESHVKGEKREYKVRCLGKCDKNERCEPKVEEKWETKKTEDGWSQDIRIVEYSDCDCKK